MLYKKIICFFIAAAVCAAASGCAKEGSDSTIPAEMTAVEAEASVNDGKSLQFSCESGFYSDDIKLEITGASGTKIYYTTDGSVPDETALLYTEPLVLKNKTSEPNVLSAQTGTSAGGDYIPRKNVKKANVIRAVAFFDDGSKSEIINGTFWIGIDREKEYGGVPVISLMTDMDNLYDYEKGIYILGKTYDEWKSEQDGHYEAWEAVGNYSCKGKEWERPVSVEFIPADGSDGFSQDMGFRIMGAASRSATQKSFRVTAREEYGKKSLEYELIPDNARSDGTGNVEKYKSFVLRNGGNDCDFAKVRDPFFQKLVSDRRFDTMASRPCVVYLNGEYWGMYTLAEDYSDNYIENNYGIDNKNVVIVKKGEIEEGNDEDIELYNELYDFIVSNDMTDNANYEKVCGMLDIGSFVDCCALNFYIYNEDSIFEGNNWQMWRVRTPDDSSEYADGKWRMLIYDTDFSSGIYSEGNNFKTDNISKVLNGSAQKNDDSDEVLREPAEMFRALYKNPDFKQELVTALCDMRNINFESYHALSVLSDMADVYMALVPDTFKRFGPDWVADQRSIEDYYSGRINELAAFIDGRYERFPEIMQKAMELGDIANVNISVSDSVAGTVLLNGNAIDMTGDFRGKYFTDYTVKVTAVPAEGKTFAGWEYSGCELSDASSAAAEVSFSGDFTIKAVFE